MLGSTSVWHRAPVVLDAISEVELDSEIVHGFDVALVAGRSLSGKNMRYMGYM